MSTFVMGSGYPGTFPLTERKRKMKKSTSIFVNRQSFRGNRPAYKKYPIQFEPQGAYIYLSEDGEVGVWINPNIGGVPLSVGYERTLVWGIPPETKGKDLRKFFADPETIDLLEKIHEGHSVEWDGHDHVGELTQESKKASETLELKIDKLFDNEEYCVW